MGAKRKVIRFHVEYPPAAEYASEELCCRCLGPTLVWRILGLPVHEVRFCPTCWKAVADDPSIILSTGAASNQQVERALAENFAPPPQSTYPKEKF